MDIELHLNHDGHKLGPELGYSIWNIAVACAPYRTGNLRSGIALQNNGPKIKRIMYNDYDAYYLNYLEEGIGRVKRHKGFIENKTVNMIYSETANYLTYGKASFSGIPTVSLRSDKARNYERIMLRNINYDLNKRITANDRAKLSGAYAKGLGQTRSVLSGERVNIVSATKIEDRL